jgi:hypothetical protein
MLPIGISRSDAISRYERPSQMSSRDVCTYEGLLAVVTLGGLFDVVDSLGRSRCPRSGHAAGSTSS